MPETSSKRFAGTPCGFCTALGRCTRHMRSWEQQRKGVRTARPLAHSACATPHDQREALQYGMCMCSKRYYSLLISHWYTREPTSSMTNVEQ